MAKIGKYLGFGVAAILALAILAYFIFQQDIKRLSFATQLFSGNDVSQQFQNFRGAFPSTDVKHDPANIHPLPKGAPLSLPETYTYAGKTLSTEALLKETDTMALTVLKDGKIVYENYWLGGDENTRFISFSVAKSFISALVGIAVEEGHIKSIQDPITDYVPSLKDSAYDGVSIKNILQMSSGASWDEDYSNPNSDINRFARVYALGGSFEEFTASLKRENEPGTVNHYNTMDTQALGLLIAYATGQSVSDYMSEKLWKPMGAEADAYWITDDLGLEFSGAGLNATSRDFARFGELYRNMGNQNGKQIVSEDWVRASYTPDGPHLMPDEEPGFLSFGYGYQWWIPYGDISDYSAIGVYNQFVYVSPMKGVVIAKSSAKKDYAQSLEEKHYRELETLMLFRAIAEALSEG